MAKTKVTARRSSAFKFRKRPNPKKSQPKETINGFIAKEVSMMWDEILGFRADTPSIAPPKQKRRGSIERSVKIKSSLMGTDDLSKPKKKGRPRSSKSKTSKEVAHRKIGKKGRPAQKKPRKTIKQTNKKCSSAGKNLAMFRYGQISKKQGTIAGQKLAMCR